MSKAEECLAIRDPALQEVPADCRARPRWRRWLPLAVLLAALGLAFAFDLHQLASMATLEAHHELLRRTVEARPVPVALAYTLGYAALVAVSIPGAVFMTIAGGFLFGTWLGGLLAATGSSIGAVLVFLVARSAVGQDLAARTGTSSWVEKMRRGFEEDAWSYLFVLRIMPVFPFWLVNIVPALLGVRLSVYTIATMLGILPGSFVYAGVGNGLEAVLAAGGRPELGVMLEPVILIPLMALVVLALLPVVWKKLRGRRRTG